MANHITNDKGETVLVVGMPGSRAYLECQRPSLIEDLEAQWVTLQSEAYRYESSLEHWDAVEQIRKEVDDLNLSDLEKENLVLIVTGAPD